MKVTLSNSVQCGAITAEVRLTSPDGGDGPNYRQV